MSNDSFIYYKKQTIANLKNELDGIPKKVAEQSAVIEAGNKKLEKLLAELQTEQGNMAPILSKINGLTARLEVLKLPAEIKEEEDNVDYHAREFSAREADIKQVQSTIDIIDKDIQKYEALLRIKNMREEESGLYVSTNQLKGQITDAENLLNIKNAGVQALSPTIQMKQGELNILLKAQAEQSRGYTSSNGSGGYTSSQSGGGYTSSQSGGGYTSSQSVHKKDHSGAIRRLRDEIATLTSQQTDLLTEASGARQSLDRLTRDLRSENKRLRELEKDLKNCGQADRDAANEKTKEDLLARIKTEEDQKKPKVEKRNRLKAELVDHLDKKTRGQELVELLQSRLSQNVKASAEFKNNHDKGNLEAQLDKQNAELKPFSDKKELLEEDIGRSRTDIARARGVIDDLTASQSTISGNTFLQAFWTRPADLLQELRGSITSGLAKYEASHPANQPAGVRFAIAQIEDRLRFIMFDEKSSKTTEDTRREKYFQLCGMLWQASADAHDAGFTAALEAMLGHPSAVCNHRVNALDKSDAVEEYTGFWTGHTVKLTDIKELPGHEEEQYSNARSDFHHMMEEFSEKPSCKEQKALSDKGFGMLKQFDEHKAAVQKKGEEFDTKFHTLILKKAHQWLYDSANGNLKTDFDALIQRNADGKPSLAKKVVGACMAFAGALVAAASVVAEVLSLGILTPITFGGMAAGGALAASGAGLFACGLQKGEQKAMGRYEEGMDKYIAWGRHRA